MSFATKNVGPLTRRLCLSLAIPLATFVPLLAAPLSASASFASATLDWGQLAVELVDTDLNDGLAPTLTPVPIHTWATCNAPGLGVCPAEPYLPTPYGEPGPVTVVTGNEFFSYARFASDKLESGSAGQLDHAGSVTLATEFDFSFFITGPARLTFTIPYELTLDDANLTHRAFAEAKLIGWTGLVDQRSVTSLTGTQVSFSGVLTGVVDATEPFWLATFVASVTTGLTSTGVAAPVPETGTVAMLLAGLGLVGAATRRRKA